MKMTKEEKLREKKRNIFDKQVAKTAARMLFVLALVSTVLDILISKKKNRLQ